MQGKFFITIGRQVGAGGLEVAIKLSGIFNIPVYDKELLSKASKDSGICKEFFENADENHTVTSAGAGIFGYSIPSVGFGGYSATTVLSGSNLFRLQCDVIREIANDHPAIFVGRCADYVLRDMPNGTSAFISAQQEDRITRLKLSKRLDDMRNMSDNQIIEYMKKEDKKRASYYNYYTYKEWGSAMSYDLCLNSSTFGTDYCAEIIAECVRRRAGM